MIRIRDISLTPTQDMGDLLEQAAKILRVKTLEIGTLKVQKKSIDARKKPEIRVIYTIDVAVHQDEVKLLKRLRNPKLSLAKENNYAPPTTTPQLPHRPVVVGFGPAGMFAALVLAEAGLKPLVLERGYDVDTRQKMVADFWLSGELNPHCNVQFGEGGAGTFSDGKLNTGVKNPRIAWILKRFVEFGAKEDIQWDAKPHVGTDVLIHVVKNLRNHLTALGAEVKFGCKMSEIYQENGHITYVSCTENGEITKIPCDHLVLAIGHSARDTFRALLAQGVPMEAKPFSMGVRMEHLQSDVDLAQYGKDYQKYNLPASDYKLAVHLDEESSAYTFCMCPGGHVVASSSQPGAVVTNGMSYQAREGKNANSALLVTLNPKDFPYPGTLGGMVWQEELERKAFVAGGSNYCAPAQLVSDFLANRPSTKWKTVTPTYAPGVKMGDLREILPEKITKTMERALPLLANKLSALRSGDGILTAPETRSSSPVRILRDETSQSTIRGLYPCGEGAGYAGGITSAAIDGIKVAEWILSE